MSTYSTYERRCHTNYHPCRRLTGNSSDEVAYALVLLFSFPTKIRHRIRIELRIAKPRISSPPWERLHIASEISKMHGGKVEAVSTSQETLFVLRILLKARLIADRQLGTFFLQRRSFVLR